MNPRIIALCGPLEGSAFALVEDCHLKIGRGKNNHVRLNDSRVATRHCCIAWEYGHCLLYVLENERGTFVNEFSRPAKILVHGDRIKIGVSIFVFLDREEVDPEQLKLTEAEKVWFNSVSYPRLGVYEPTKEAVLEAFLNTTSSVTGLRSSEEIQAEILDLILSVIPADYAAILLTGHDQDHFISMRYGRRGSQNGGSFPIDETISMKVLREATPICREKIACCPVTVGDTKVGVIYAVIEKAAFEDFTAAHAKLFDSIAGLAAVTLEHARYVEWLEGENQRLNEIINLEHGMIGRSEKMKQAYEFVSRAGPSDRSVLITGETGTGKELLARALHRNSPRRDKRFFSLNCAAMPADLLENELFGHEKESFTGAATQRKGLFELADGGTLFLDEVGEMPLLMQAKLLRVLQEGEFRRLGGAADVKVNVRVIAATNRTLKAEVEASRFRSDLYFRLNVLSFEMPRLADRREDIPLLAAHFIQKHRDARSGEFPAVVGISPEAQALLAAYSWPGNVRELENVIEHGIAMGTLPYILPDDLPPALRPKTSDSAETGIYWREKPIWEKSLFAAVLVQTGGNKPETARHLGLSVKYFYARCKELGL